ncbi:MAG TPA: transporter substrate-binding domain-containing protein, partial [Amaricoccus sp.]|nr:transporter substrate-binding domain-containing protein [Amaricoccus sp.]
MRRVFAAALGLAVALALPALAQEKLKIGTEAAYKPFAWVLPSGELTGFDIDITKALCAQMQADCEIVNQSFDGLIPALRAKKINAIIASMSITPDREKAIDFAGPYYNVPALFIAAKDSGIQLTPDGMSGKTVGVQRGTTMANYVKNVFPGARIQLYD